MLMNEIPKYIELRGNVSLLELARHFHLNESAMQQMVSFWVKKEKIKLISSPPSTCPPKQCNGCSQCPDNSTEIYSINNPEN